MKLQFDIVFESDYHIGAGFGLPPEVDSALHRDADNVPVIRGSILTGLLRQALYDLMQLPPVRSQQRCQISGRPQNGKNEYCGKWHTGEDPCPICAIFGSPRQMKHWRISSARPAQLMSPQRKANDWRPGETAAQVTTRVRVNPRTRRAVSNKLFTREEGDGRLAFRFTVESQANDAKTWEEAAWLVAAARMVRRLGAGKNRGLGECEIKLLGVEDGRDRLEVLLDRFSDLLNGKATAPDMAEASTVELWNLSAQPEQHTFRIRVLLRTDEPLLIAQRAEAGNQFESVQTIPGSALRGALAWRVAQRYDLTEGSAAYENFVNLFFHHAVRFSPLLPTQSDPGDPYHQCHPAIPAPRDLCTCEIHPGYKDGKPKGHGVWSLAWDDTPGEFCPECHKLNPAQETGLKTLNGFIGLNRAQPATDSAPKQAVEMHIRIDPKTGRVNPGDLYGYVTLEAGQYFVGEISCTDEDTWKVLQEMCGLAVQNEVTHLRLGKANRRGYGKVSMVGETAQSSPWQGGDIGQRVDNPARVVLLLLSDAIVHDSCGRSVQGFESSWLNRELDLPDKAAIKVDPTRAFSAVRPIQSFNAKLGLPRSRDMAMAAGSCVRISFDGIDLPSLRQKLANVESKGIGLRRDEGFGLVVFNHAIHTGFSSWNEDSLDLDAIMLGADSHPLTAIADFEKKWQDTLDKDLNDRDFAHEPFEATARLVHTTPGEKAFGLPARLDKMGDQKEVLERDLKGRDRTNFYQKGGGRPGMETISELLTTLGQLVEQSTNAGADKYQLWKIGLEMLADRVAAPARKKVDERSNSS